MKSLKRKSLQPMGPAESSKKIDIARLNSSIDNYTTRGSISQQSIDASREKTFQKLSHRYYFIVDQPPEQAFISYMNVTRQSALSAIAALSDVSEKELDWIRGFRDRTQSFKYKIPLSEKIKYIKEIGKAYGRT